MLGTHRYMQCDSYNNIGHTSLPNISLLLTDINDTYTQYTHCNKQWHVHDYVRLVIVTVSVY